MYAAVTQALAYAASRHARQRRKGAGAIPYINHLVDVADRLAQSRHGDDLILLQGGILHDIVEDTEGTADEIAALFGSEVAALVLEVTDDKSLPKKQRKQAQVDNAPKKSPRAALVKLADKTSNLTSLVETPPGWGHARMVEYADWADRVTRPLRGRDDLLDAGYDAAMTRLRAHLSVA
jgi:(p)ppGpp synthase/HD superfamily hydrolase